MFPNADLQTSAICDIPATAVTPDRAYQVPSIAAVLWRGARLESLALLTDAVDLARTCIRSQFSAVDVIASASWFTVADVSILTFGGEQDSISHRVNAPHTQSPGTKNYDIIYLVDFKDSEASGEATAKMTEWLHRQFVAGARFIACGRSASLLGLAVISAQYQEANNSNGLNRGAPGSRTIAYWPKLIDPSFGRVTCTSGGTSDISVVVGLIKDLTSTKTAHWVARRLSADCQETITELGGGDQLVARAKDWLVERFSQSVHINELAHAMGVNRRTLQRRFKHQTGASPAAYLESIRLDSAKQMLSRTNLNIDRIAGMIGYSDLGHFRRIFRRRIGMSARDWRKTSRQ